MVEATVEPRRLGVISQLHEARRYRDWMPQILVPDSLPAARRHPVLVVVNQKGGTGKTTTAVELGAVLAAAGMAVRLIDCDPQEGSASDWLRTHAGRGTLVNVFLNGMPLDQVTYSTCVDDLEIVPSDLTLAQVEYARPAGAETALGAAIAKSYHYDVTLIDCTPSLGLLTIAALGAATDAIIPLKAGGLDITAVTSLNRTIGQVRKKINDQLRVRAVLLTAVQRSNLTRDIFAQLAHDYPDSIIAPIRHSVRAAEAPLAGRPIREHAPDSTAANDYGQVAPLIAGA
jgi:chromosome partitioning protein